MGLGKTIQTSVTLSHIRACLLNNSPKRAARMPFLVVAPVSTLVNWKREIGDRSHCQYRKSAKSYELVVDEEAPVVLRGLDTPNSDCISRH